MAVSEASDRCRCTWPLAVTVLLACFSCASCTSDATLSALATESCSDITQGSLEPAFNSSITEYSAVVSYQCSLDDFYYRLLGMRSNAQTIKLTPTCSGSCSSIAVTYPDGTNVTGTSGSAFEIPIPIGVVSGLTVDAVSPIPIEVTAQDGTTTATYNVNVTRLAKSTMASMLDLVILDSVLYQLNPWGLGFNETVTEYFIEVESTVDSVSVVGSNSQVFSVTTAELNPSGLASNSTGSAVILANGTALNVSGLVAGSNNTLRIRVHAEAFQPEQKFGYFSPLAYQDYDVTIFRRSLSNSTDLNAITVESVEVSSTVTAVSAGTLTQLSPTFSSSTTSYSCSVPFSVSGISVTPYAPPTSGSVSVIDNASRATISVGGAVTPSGVKSSTLQLAVGDNTILVTVTSEDGASSATYSILVSRAVPNTDTTLASLIPSEGWLVADGQDNVTGSVLQPSAAFSPGSLVYSIEAGNVYTYLGAAVPNSISSISFIPVANASVGGIPAVTILVNGVPVASNTTSQDIILPDSAFPAHSITTVEILVSSEDGSVSTAYVVTVTRAPARPDSSFFVPFYRLSGGPSVSTVTVPSGSTNVWVTADDLVPMVLEVDAALWNATFFSSPTPGLANDLSAIGTISFQPRMSLNGGPYVNYGPPAVLLENSTSKSVNFFLNGGVPGEVSIIVTADSLDVAGTVTYGLKHGLMSLADSVMTGETSLKPGLATFVLTPYDAHGNLITDGERLYSDQEIEALVCSPGEGTGNESIVAISDNDCPCASVGSCEPTGTGSLAYVPSNRAFNVYYTTLLSGVNYLLMTGTYSFNSPIAAPDVLQGSPTEVFVSSDGVGLGIRSLVETIPYRSWIVKEDPCFFFVHARDDYGNDLAGGGQAESLLVTTEPRMVDGNGIEVQAEIEDVTTSGGRGMYRVTLPGVVAQTYQVTVKVVPSGIQIDGSGFEVPLLPATFSPETTQVSYLASVVAGELSSGIEVRAMDRFGNWLQNDDYTEFFEGGLYQAVSQGNNWELIADMSIEKDFVSGIYRGSFQAPTTAGAGYGIKMFALSFPSLDSSVALSRLPQAMAVLPDNPVAEQSKIEIPGIAVAGVMEVKVEGFDGYGNAAPHGLWTAIATLSSQDSTSSTSATRVEAEASPKARDVFAGDLSQVAYLGESGLVTAGAYSIAIYLEGKEVSSAATGGALPATTQILPAAISSLSEIGTVPGQVSVGAAIEVEITAVDTYGNRISAGGESRLISVYTSNSADPLDTFPSTVLDVGEGVYSINFAVSRAGTYNLAIRFGGVLKEPVSEFTVVAPLTAADDFTVTADAAYSRLTGVYEAPAGKQVTFIVTAVDELPAFKVENAVVAARLDNEDLGTSERIDPVKILNDDGVLQRVVTVLTQTAGRYKLHVLVEGLELVGSPYVLDLIAGTASELFAEPLEQLSYVAGSDVELVIQILDEAKNTLAVDTSTELLVTWKQQPGGQAMRAETEARDTRVGGYLARLPLYSAAVYYPEVLYTSRVDQQVRRLCLPGAAAENCIPSIIVVPDIAFPAASLLSGSCAAPTPLPAGDPATLIVTSLDAHGNEVAKNYAATELQYHVEVSGPQGQVEVLPLNYAPDDSTHRVTHALAAAGVYQVNVRKIGPRDEDPAKLRDALFPYTVGGAPCQLTVVPGEVSLPNSVLLGDPVQSEVRGRAGSEIKVDFVLRDEFNNTVLDDLSSSAVVRISGGYESMPMEIPASPGGLIFDASTGHYSTTPALYISGKYDIDVVLRGIPVRIGTLLVDSGSISAKLSRAVGPGLISATAGIPASFLLAIVDDLGNRFESYDASQLQLTVAMQVLPQNDKPAVDLPPGNATISWDEFKLGYEVEYISSIAGTLTIKTLIGGITPEPVVSFQVQVIGGQASASESTVTGSLLTGYGTSNDAVLFEVQAADVYGNLKSTSGDAFSVTCFAPSGCLETSDSDLSYSGYGGRYHGTFTAFEAKVFSVSIMLNGQNVGRFPHKSPFSLTVLEAGLGLIDYGKTQAVGSGLYSAQAGKKASFTIVAYDNNGARLQKGDQFFYVELVTQDGGSTPALVADIGNGGYEVSYTLSRSGPHSLMVWADQARTVTIGTPALGESWPTTVFVQPGPTDPAFCTIDQPLPSAALVGEEIKATISPFDSFGNRQEYRSGAHGNDEFVFLALTEDGRTAAYGEVAISEDFTDFLASIRLTRPGRYRLQIYHQDLDSGRLTLLGTQEQDHLIVISAGAPDPTKSLLIGIPSQGVSQRVAEMFSVFVEVNDEAGNLADGYQLYQGVTSQAGPQRLVCQARLQPAEGPNAGCAMGGDRVGPQTGICPCIDVACAPSNAAGILELVTTSQCAGKHLLYIDLNQIPMASSPVPVRLQAGNIAAGNTILKGTGLVSATSGYQTEVTIQAADEYGNLITVGGEQFTVVLQHVVLEVMGSVKDNADGTYSGMYTPSLSGSHELYVYLNGFQRVGSSPYSLTVNLPSRASAKNSYIATQVGTVQAGEVAAVTVIAMSDAAVLMRGDLAAAVSFEATLTPSGNGFGQMLTPMAERVSQDSAAYEVRFMVERDLPQDDPYYELNVKLDGEHVNGSPMRFICLPGSASAARSQVFLPGSVSSGRVESGIDVELVLQLRDPFGNDLRGESVVDTPRITAAYMQDSEVQGSEQSEMEVMRLGDGTRFQLTLKPVNAGAGRLDIRVDGQPIPDPVSIEVVAGPPDLSSFVLRGPGIEGTATAGKATYLTLEVRDKHGNFIQDDGRLVCFAGNPINPGVDPSLCLDKKLEVAEAYVEASNGTVVGVKKSELQFEPADGPLSDGGAQLTWQAGMYRIILLANNAGMLHIQLKMGDDSLSVPTIRVVPDAVDPASVTISGLGRSGVMLGPDNSPAATTRLFIEPRDFYGNLVPALPGDSSFSVAASLLDLVSGPVDSEINVSGPALSEDDKGYSFTFVVRDMGTLLLDISLDGTPIGDGKQLQIDVHEYIGPTSLDPRWTFVGSSFLRTGMLQAGQEVPVVVTLAAANRDSNCIDCRGMPFPYSAGRNIVTAKLNFQDLDTVVDQEDGTYSLSVSSIHSGFQSLEILLGPDLSNPRIGQNAVPIGDTMGIYPFRVVAAATSGATIELRDGLSRNAIDWGDLQLQYFAAHPLVINILPTDRYGNKQDYALAPADDFRVDVTYNNMLGVEAAQPQRQISQDGITFFFESEMRFYMAGTYMLDVQLRNTATDGAWISVAGTISAKILPGLPSAQTSVISTGGVQVAAVGIPSSFRLRLVDQAGNDVGSGSAQEALAKQLELNMKADSNQGDDGLDAANPAMRGRSRRMLQLDTRDAKGATNSTRTENPAIMSATLRDVSAGVSLAVQITYDEQDGVYKGQYTPWNAGEYTLDVYLYGSKFEIPTGSSGTLVMGGTLDTSSCVLTGTGTGDAGPITAGQVTEFLIQSNDEDGHHLGYGGAAWDVKLISADRVALQEGDVDWIPNGQHVVHGNVIDNNDGTYRVEYSPQIAATYLLSVTRGANGVHAARSPLAVEVRAAATSAARSMLVCDPDAPASCGLSNRTQAGSQGIFYIQAKDELGGNATNVADSFVYEIAGAKGYFKLGVANLRGAQYPGQYSASFNTEVAGLATISVSLRGEPVAKETITVLPGRADPSQCTLSSTSSPESEVWLPGSSPGVVVLTARDVYGNQLQDGGLDFTVRISSRNRAFAADLTLTDNEDGTYHAPFVITQSGPYVVTGKLGLESLRDTVDTLLTPGPAVLANTGVEPCGGQMLSAGFEAGTEGCLLIAMRDTWSNAIPGCDHKLADALHISIFKGQHEFRKDLSLQEHIEGCQVAFQPMESGTMRLRISSMGDSLVDTVTRMPLSAPVLPGPASASKTTVTGGAFRGCVGGRPCSLALLLADQYGNSFDRQGLLSNTEQSIAVFFSLPGGSAGPRDVAVASIVQDVRELSSGTIQIEFTPPQYLGDYVILADISIISPDPSKSGQVSQQLIPIVLGNDAVDASMSHLVNEAGDVVVPGSYLGNFSAASGPVILGHIQVMDRNGLDMVDDAISTEWIQLAVQPHIDGLSVASTGKPGQFSIALRPVRTGMHILDVRLGGQHTVGTFPFAVTPAFPSSAMMSRLQFSPQEMVQSESGNAIAAVAGIPISFSIEPVDAYGNRQALLPGHEESFAGQLRHHGSMDEQILPCTVFFDPKGGYRAECLTTKVGIYDLEVFLWDPESQLLLPVGNKTSVHVRHAAVFAPRSAIMPPPQQIRDKSIMCGSAMSFIVQPMDAYGNNATTIVVHFTLGLERLVDSNWEDAAADASLELLDGPNGTYVASVIPWRAGQHRLTVRHKESGLLVNETILFDAAPGPAIASRSDASGNGLLGGIAEELLEFTVNLVDEFGNPSPHDVSQLVVDVSSDSADSGEIWSLGDIEETLPGILQVRYKMFAVGEHKLHVRLGGEPLPQSPWRVTAAMRPAPFMLAAAFASNFASLSITFSEPTDRGAELGEPISENCGKFFPANSVSRFGIEPRCVWEADDMLQLYLGRAFTLEATSESTDGHRLQLAPDEVHSKRRNSYGVSNMVDIKRPHEQQPPTAFLTVPSVVGICDSLVLDALPSVAGAGHDLSYKFSAVPADGLPSGIQQALQDAERMSDTPGLVSLPSTAMDPERPYTFSVRVENREGLIDTASATVTRSSLPVPMVKILGPSEKHVLRGEGVTLRSLVELPNLTCMVGNLPSMDEEMTFVWQLVDGLDLQEKDVYNAEDWELYEQSLSMRNLYLPTGILQDALRPDGSPSRATFRFIAMHGSLRSSAEMQLTIESDSIAGHIVGGDRHVSPLTPVTLEVAVLDQSVGDDSESLQTSYLWTCHREDGSACYGSGSKSNAIMATAKGKLDLEANELVPGVYIFSVSLSTEPVTTGRQITCSAVLTVLDYDVTPVSIEIASAGAISNMESVLLKASAAPCGADSLDDCMQEVTVWNWSCMEGHLSEPGALEDAAQTSLQGSSLLLRAGALMPGQQYRFRVQSMTASGSIGTAEIPLQTSSAPWGGTLEINAENGGVQSGRLQASEGMDLVATVHGWMAASAFDLYYIPDILTSKVTSEERFLGGISDSGVYLAFTLPRGTHMIVAYISSKDGGSVRVVYPLLVEVAEPSLQRRSLLQTDDELNEKWVDMFIRPALAMGKIDSVLQLSDIYSRILMPNRIVSNLEPSEGCEVSGVTEEIAEVSMELFSQVPSSERGRQQHICRMARLVSDPTQVTLGMAVSGLESVLDLLPKLAGVTQSLDTVQCFAEMVSSVTQFTFQECHADPPDDNVLTLIRTSLSRMLQAVAKGNRPGMAPLVLDTPSFAIHIAAHSRRTTAYGRLESADIGYASYNISLSNIFWNPAVDEIHGMLVVPKKHSLLPAESVDERLASLPATLELLPVHLRMELKKSNKPNIDIFEIPPIPMAYLDRKGPAAADRANRVYIWRGADWASLGSTMVQIGEDLVTRFDAITAGFESKHPNTISFAAWLTDSGAPAPPFPSAPPGSASPPAVPGPDVPQDVPVADDGSSIAIQWIIVPVAICAVCALLLLAGVCFWRRQKVSPRRQGESLHQKESKSNGDSQSQWILDAEDTDKTQSKAMDASEDSIERSLGKIDSSSSNGSVICSSDDDENDWAPHHYHKPSQQQSKTSSQRQKQQKAARHEEMVSWGVKNSPPDEEGDEFDIEVPMGVPRGLRMVSGPIAPPAGNAIQPGVLFANKRPKRQI